MLPYCRRLRYAVIFAMLRYAMLLIRHADMILQR